MSCHSSTAVLSLVYYLLTLSLNTWVANCTQTAANNDIIIWPALTIYKINFNAVSNGIIADLFSETRSPAVAKIVDRTGCQWPWRSSKVHDYHLILSFPR